jgi:hypothetical protein
VSKEREWPQDITSSSNCLNPLFGETWLEIILSLIVGLAISGLSSIEKRTRLCACLRESMSTTVGTRINFNGSFGTIRYVGEVGQSPETWLGVEWDDPKRGKHSGSHRGHQYFISKFVSLRSSPGFLSISVVVSQMLQLSFARLKIFLLESLFLRL